MKRKEVVSFIISACSYLRLSQAKTLSNLVAAAMKLTRVLKIYPFGIDCPIVLKERLFAIYREDYV